MTAFEGKVALVTGSSRGIGAAIARFFARQGAAVAVHGRDVAALDAVATDIERGGGRALRVAADVTRFAEIEAIITISSFAGHRAHPGAPIPYAAAKAGVEMLTKDLAAQAGPYGIRVNCIAPETILTERNAERIPEATRRMLVDAHPLKRLGTPEDVAQTALFLASDEASWITGIVVDVAGGTAT